MVARGLGVVGLFCSMALGCGEDGRSPTQESAGAAGAAGSVAGASGMPGSGGSGSDGEPGAEAGSPAAAGADPGRGGTRPLCDPSTAFGAARPLTELNTDLPDTGARLTSDELTIVFERNNEIFIAERASRDEAFGEAVSLSLSEPSNQGAPWISDDRLALFFESEGLDSYVMIRDDESAPFQGL